MGTYYAFISGSTGIPKFTGSNEIIVTNTGLTASTTVVPALTSSYAGGV